MKTIYFIRHAKSDWSVSGQPDHARSLNSRGKRDALQMAKLLKLNSAVPNAMITSSAERALQTALTFQKIFDLKEEHFTVNPSLYHAPAEKVLEEISLVPDAYSTLMVFIHNPGITELADIFSGPVIENVPTTGILKVEFTMAIWQEISPIKGTITDFMYPKMYA